MKILSTILIFALFLQPFHYGAVSANYLFIFYPLFITLSKQRFIIPANSILICICLFYSILFLGFILQPEYLQFGTRRFISFILFTLMFSFSFIQIDEKLVYSLFNLIDQDNKYLIVTSLQPIVDINFNLVDLKSRAKNFLLYNIEKPDDELMFALILKNLSDRQISIDEKLINFIIKRIDRSYGKIFDFIYKIDEISLKKKKSIDLKIVKEVLGD